MAETIKLPGIGPVPKAYAYAGAALVVGIAGYAWWSRSRGGTGGTTYGVDPSTGSATGSNVYGNPDPNTPDPYNEPPAAPRNNQEWTSRVLIALAEQGIEPTFASVTIGRYLDRRPLSNQEADLVRQAWALMGKPPEGPTTFTLDPGTSTPGNPPSGTYTGPAVRDPKPEIGDWDKGNVGWMKSQHSLWLAEYRGMYGNRAPAGSATEGIHVSALRLRNATHGGPNTKPGLASQGWLIFVPRYLYDNGTWKDQ